MSRRFLPLALLAALVAGLAGCSSRQALFVVLPNPGGGSGAVTVSDNGGQSVVVDQPYGAAEVRSGQVVAATSGQDQVQKVFGSALAAQPILPAHFRLYFESDSEVLTPASALEYKKVFDDIKRRPVYQVEVIGHTDTFASKDYNQRLSLKRADAIKERLVRDGLDPKSIAVAGRGELDLAVPTPNGVHEPRNRRVEITVR
jgi:outer membrane protein OmpA-like peptidoglycan-associated protein